MLKSSCSKHWTSFKVLKNPASLNRQTRTLEVHSEWNRALHFLLEWNRKLAALLDAISKIHASWSTLDLLFYKKTPNQNIFQADDPSRFTQNKANSIHQAKQSTKLKSHIGLRVGKRLRRSQNQTLIFSKNEDVLDAIRHALSWQQEERLLALETKRGR